MWDIKAGDFSGGILSIDISGEKGWCLFAVGTMSGDLVVLREHEGGQVERLAASKCHTKYLHRCIWASSYLVSAGHDQTICISTYHDGQIDLLRRVPFASAVNDVAFHEPSSSLVVSLKDSYCLRVIDLPGLINGPGCKDEAAGWQT